MPRTQVIVRDASPQAPHTVEIASHGDWPRLTPGRSIWGCTCGEWGDGLEAHKAAYAHAWGGTTLPTGHVPHARVISIVG